MSCTLAIKNKEGSFNRFTVPEEVYMYVRQLEAIIFEAESCMEESETSFYKGMRSLHRLGELRSES